MIGFKETGNNDWKAQCAAIPGYRESLADHKVHLPLDRHVFKLGGGIEGSDMFFEIIPGAFPQRVGVKIVKN